MRTVLVLSTLFTLACGGAMPPPRADAGPTPTPPPPPVDAGPPPVTDAGLPPPPMDAGTPPPVDAGTSAVAGLVEVELTAGLEMIIPVTTSVTASFGPPITGSSNCRSRAVATCTVTDCDLAASDGGAGEPDPVDAGAQPPPTGPVTAGRLSIDEGSTRITLEPDPMTGGYQFAEEGERLRPGTALTITAAGAQVPAFVAPLPLPERVTVTSPTCSFAGCGTLDRTQDLPVAWTGARGPVTVTLSGGSDDAVRIIECQATASPAAIPAAAMRGMPTEYVLFQVARRSEAVVRAGAVPVTLRATTQSVLGAFLQSR